MKCKQCGFEAEQGARFCSACGAQLERSGETTTLFAIPAEDFTEPRADVPQSSDLAVGNALLLVKRGDGDGARFLIDTDTTNVGRHPESDIFLDDITVSRHHARFIRHDGSFFVEDLGSLNGTYVNRTLVDGRVALNQGDEIQIGKYRATFSLAN